MVIVETVESYVELTLNNWLHESIAIQRPDFLELLYMIGKEGEFSPSTTFEEFRDWVVLALENTDNSKEKAIMERVVSNWLFNFIDSNVHYPDNKLDKYKLEDVFTRERGGRYYANCFGRSRLYRGLGIDFGLDVGIVEVLRAVDGSEVYHVCNITRFSDVPDGLDAQWKLEDLNVSNNDIHHQKIRARVEEKEVYVDIDWDGGECIYKEGVRGQSKSIAKINMRGLNKKSIKAIEHYNAGYINIERGMRARVQSNTKRADEMFGKAIEELKKAIKLDPKFAGARYNLGLIYYQEQGKVEEAIKEITLALKENPEDSEGHNALGGIYREQGEYEKAVKEGKEAVRLNPKNGEAHYNLGAVYFKLGEESSGEEKIKYFELSLREFEQAIKYVRELKGELRGIIDFLKGAIKKGKDSKKETQPKGKSSLPRSSPPVGLLPLKYRIPVDAPLAKEESSRVSMATQPGAEEGSGRISMAQQNTDDVGGSGLTGMSSVPGGVGQAGGVGSMVVPQGDLADVGPVSRMPVGMVQSQLGQLQQQFEMGSVGSRVGALRQFGRLAVVNPQAVTSQHVGVIMAGLVDGSAAVRMVALQVFGEVFSVNPDAIKDEHWEKLNSWLRSEYGGSGLIIDEPVNDWDELQEKVKTALAEASTIDEKSAIEKKIADGLFEFILRNIAYEEDAFDLDKILKQEEANCLGYSLLYMILGNKLGLGNVIGVVDVEIDKYDRKVVHSANIVRFSNGKWHLKDLAYEDTWCKHQRIRTRVKTDNDKEYKIRSVDINWDENTCAYTNHEGQARDKVDIIGLSKNSVKADVFYSIGKNTDDLDEKIEAYEKVIELEPKEGRGYYALGGAYDEKGDYDKAIEAYQKAIEVDPEYDAPHYALGNIYYNVKEDYDKAIEAYEKTIEVDPEYDAPHYALGNIYYKVKKDYDKAIDAYQKAIELDPEDAKHHHALGAIYYMKGEYDAAIKLYKKAIELDPEDADYHGSLGRAYQKKSNLDLAVEAYKKAIELDPKYLRAYEGLKNIYINQGRSKRQELYATLGMINFLKQKYDSAIKSLKKAIELNPKDAEAHYKLGMVYQEQGDKSSEKDKTSYYELALKEYEEAVELAPGEYKKKLERTIEKLKQKTGKEKSSLPSTSSPVGMIQAEEIEARLVSLQQDITEVDKARYKIGNKMIKAIRKGELAYLPLLRLLTVDEKGLEPITFESLLKPGIKGRLDRAMIKGDVLTAEELEVMNGLVSLLNSEFEQKLELKAIDSIGPSVPSQADAAVMSDSLPDANSLDFDPAQEKAKTIDPSVMPLPSMEFTQPLDIAEEDLKEVEPGLKNQFKRYCRIFNKIVKLSKAEKVDIPERGREFVVKALEGILLRKGRFPVNIRFLKDNDPRLSDRLALSINNMIYFRESATAQEILAYITHEVKHLLSVDETSPVKSEIALIGHAKGIVKILREAKPEGDLQEHLKRLADTVEYFALVYELRLATASVQATEEGKQILNKYKLGTIAHAPPGYLESTAQAYPGKNVVAVKRDPAFETAFNKILEQNPSPKRLEFLILKDLVKFNRRAISSLMNGINQQIEGWVDKLLGSDEKFMREFFSNLPYEDRKEIQEIFESSDKKKLASFQKWVRERLDNFQSEERQRYEERGVEVDKTIENLILIDKSSFERKIKRFLFHLIKGAVSYKGSLYELSIVLLEEQANCVGMSLLFKLLAEEFGLDVGIVEVIKNSFGEDMLHVCNIHRNSYGDIYLIDITGWDPRDPGYKLIAARDIETGEYEHISREEFEKKGAASLTQEDIEVIIFHWRGANAYKDFYGNLDDIIANYERVIHLSHPRFTPRAGIQQRCSVAYYHRAMDYYIRGMLDEAFADCSRAIELDPEYANPYYRRGKVHYDQGRLDEAIADYSRAIEIDPDDANVFYLRGDVYYDQGKFEKAIADYDQSRKINSDGPYSSQAFWKGYSARKKLEELEEKKGIEGEKEGESSNVKESQSSDAAMMSDVGGIDFNPANLNLQIRRDGNGVPLPVHQQDIENIQIEGLTPVIINIIPATYQHLPFLSSEGKEEDQKLSLVR